MTPYDAGTTIAVTTAEIDRMRGDLEATTYLLNDAIEERDALSRKLNQVVGELGEVRAQLTWLAQR
jgi:hypothetical protein